MENIFQILASCMEETPKKIVGNNCFLCSFPLIPQARIRVFGKSSVDIAHLIQCAVEIDLSVFSSSDPFVCNRCYKRLLRFEKAKTNLRSLQEEIKEDFKKGANRTKRLRRNSAEKDGDIENTDVSIAPSTALQMRVQQRSAAKSLKFEQFPTTSTSSNAENDRTVGESYNILGGSTWLSAQETPSTREGLFILPPPPSLHLTSTPIAKTGNFHSQSGTEPCNPAVKISIQYSSKPLNKRLPSDYESIGKALVYGPPERIAKAVVKCKLLTKHVLQNVLRLLSSEVCGLCSRSNPSLLRKCDKDDLIKLNFQSLCEEWKDRAPIFYSFLMTCCSVQLSRDESWFPSMAVAGSVLLKQRNSQMNALASVLGILIKTRSIEGTLDRLTKLKVTCSNKCVLSKLDSLGESFDRPLKAAKERISSENLKTKELQERANAASHVCSLDSCAEECLAQKLSIQAIQSLKEHKVICHPGFVIAYDNIDLEISRKNMTMAKQNRDVHWVNHQMFLNRVSGNLLPNEAPQQDLQTVANVTFLPNASDQLRQRFNYIVLVSRMLVEYFDAFQPLKDACMQHMPHKYSNEMSQKSVKVPLGVIFKNENKNEEMLAILQQFHSYLPQTADGGYDPQLFAGDQLTIERAVNVISSVANGYSPKDRLEGITSQLGDWHAGVKILSLIFKKFFSGKSESDSCTLNSDRILINRRNVKSDPHTAYRADRDFLLVVLKSRVLAAAMSVLGFADKESQPSKLPLPADITKQPKVRRLQYLHKAASLIVDKFVFNDEVVNRLLDDILTSQQTQDVQDQQDRTTDGRFPCRFPGCQFSFKYDGASRRRHELTHDPPPEVESASTQGQADSAKSTSKPTKSSDDVYNYNCALLGDGLFFINFLDAVKEGDGKRLMRQYKYMLLYCKADGQASNKYALECLYQSFLVHSVLSPRESERFVWNRGVNNKGGRGNNIPSDLEVEHSNCYVKGSCKNLGPNLSEKAVQRICNSESGSRAMFDNMDQSINRFRKSGRHTSSSLENDTEELLKRITQIDVFTEHPGRSYHCFADFERDPFKSVDMTSLYKWINQHKKNMLQGNRAR